MNKKILILEDGTYVLLLIECTHIDMMGLHNYILIHRPSVRMPLPCYIIWQRAWEDISVVMLHNKDYGLSPMTKLNYLRFCLARDLSFPFH